MAVVSGLQPRPLRLRDVTALAATHRQHRFEPTEGTLIVMPPDTRSVLLAVEIVSPSSERIDRWFKPLAYAKAGIPHLWRIEPDGTVLRSQLLDGEVPDLS